MGDNISILVTIAAYVIGLSAMWGSITARLKTLEKKMDKHNTLMERMVKAEGSTASAHYRLDELKDEICDLQHKQ